MDRSAPDTSIGSERQEREGLVYGDPHGPHATLSGEAEAVNVETRARLEAGARGKTPPWQTMQPDGEQLYWAGAAKAPTRPSGIMMKLGGPGSKPASEPGNEKVLFGGENAASANQGMLANAEAMAAQGEKRDAIWRATGWWQGSDKIWRFEIPDDDAALTKDGAALYAYVLANPKATRATTVGTLLVHPLLKKAYPDLFGIKLLIASPRSKALQGDSGGWEPSTRTITVGATPDLKERLSSLLHEIQHAIQDDAEDWPEAPEHTPYHKKQEEAEAFNIERRLPLKGKQRRDRPPWTTFAVPERSVVWGQPQKTKPEHHSTRKPRNKLDQFDGPSAEPSARPWYERLRVPLSAARQLQPPLTLIATRRQSGTTARPLTDLCHRRLRPTRRQRPD